MKNTKEATNAAHPPSGGDDETAALRRRVAELEAALEESRKAADLAVGSVAAVAIHKVDDSFDVQAYPSLDEAQAGLAARLREWKDGFWKEGEAERLDDAKLIDEYARRNGHEEVWLGPVAVSGVSPSLGTAADGQAGGKPKILVTLRDGAVYGWDTNMDAAGLAVAVFDQDAFDAGDNWEIPPGFKDVTPQWIKDLLEEREREAAGDGPAM